MFCTRCGKKAGESIKFCTGCGNALPQLQSLNLAAANCEAIFELPQAQAVNRVNEISEITFEQSSVIARTEKGVNIIPGYQDLADEMEGKKQKSKNIGLLAIVGVPVLLLLLWLLITMDCDSGKKTSQKQSTSFAEQQKQILDASEKNSANTAPTGSFFTDSRDGKKYRTVKIGNLNWLAENLNYQTQNSWCYSNNSSNCTKYGRLYTWNAAMNACPTGWRLPTRADFNNLIQTAGSEIAGKKLKSKTGWDSWESDNGGNGTDAYGFSALPASRREYDGGYFEIGIFSNWWSATAYNNNYAYFLYITKYSGSAWISNGVPEDADDIALHKGYGFYVRCIKD